MIKINIKNQNDKYLGMKLLQFLMNLKRPWLNVRMPPCS
jgi:hypothetical protein